jgi:hypothetical protein
MSTGYYHRHAFPRDTGCHLCPVTTPPTVETPLHLFQQCTTAARVWNAIDNRVWNKFTDVPLPSDDWSRLTGDASHLPLFPLCDFYRIVHALAISRIYIQRCQLVFNRSGDSSPARIAAEVAGALKTDIADAIRASWAITRAATKEKGLIAFSTLWNSDHLHDLIRITEITNFDPITQQHGPGHGHNRLKVLF